MIGRQAGLIAAFGAFAAMASAEDLSLPGNAANQISTTSSPDSFRIATAPWADGALPSVTAEGTVTRNVWRIPAPGITTLQLLRPLRDQLTAAGFTPLFTCETEACGGYDFRFAIDVSPPPQMQVDLGDFRYFAAARTTAEGDFHTVLLVSRSTAAGFVEVVQVTPEGITPAASEAQGSSLRASPEGAPQDLPLPEALNVIGRAVLQDLTFATGSAQLGDGTYDSLRVLADFLAANPEITVALVGHTDASGSLDGNISLSKRRAGSVLERLVSVYNVPRRQLAAEGMGYLAPIANNRTAEGRESNRRVEVIVTATQ